MKSSNNIGALLMVILFSPALTRGQSKPELPFTISSASSYGIVNGLLFDFSLGEMVLVQTFNEAPGFLFSQGFLQPYLLAPNSVSDVFTDNNIITPNNDGKNDLLIIKGLENYPGSVLNIYDRAGRKVFTSIDYKNNWDATVNGKALNEDTYYYVIDLGKSRGKVTGFVSIVRDNY